ncbi:MAG: hypothetical protein ACPL6D_04305 [Thermodesulfobacteriota bacterium]
MGRKKLEAIFSFLKRLRLKNEEISCPPCFKKIDNFRILNNKIYQIRKFIKEVKDERV